MIRLEKYFESNMSGRSKRIAFVTSIEKLPTPLVGFAWKIDQSFNIADELTHDPEKARYYREALLKGVSIVIE